MKSTRKSLQRVGQRYTDEIFEDIRKREFSAPSLFVSLWVTNSEDASIFRKAWEETGFTTGYLYEVMPVAPPYEVEPYWEVMACRAVTQSKMRRELLPFVEDMARKFWTPQIVDGGIRDYLCPQGAIITRLIREVKPPDFHSS